MIVKYRAFSWTYTPEQLQKVLIDQMSEALGRALKYTEKNVGDDDDRLAVLEALKLIKADLEAGLESPSEWLDTVAWSWQVQALEPTVSAGSYGTASYYTKIKDGDEVPLEALGKTRVLIDRESVHLDLTINVVN